MVEVETTLAGGLDEVVLFMPVWSPGSYLVREYARHVESLSVDAPAVATKVRKSAWRIDRNGADEVVIRHRLYANELSVRTNHVDETHAFLVGAALFLGVEGHLSESARASSIEAPAGWRIATPAAAGRRRRRPGRADFDTLVDSPLEIGLHREDRFEVLGKPPPLRRSGRPMALSDRDVAAPGRRHRARSSSSEAGLFGGTLPYDDYEILLLHLSPRARGGLEHRASAALVAPPDAFATRDGYLDLLSLIAHEAFHAWNVKRIRPAGLTPYRYEEECYTRLLWWFEGATSYYDWRVLRLTKLCAVGEYLQHLADEIAYLDATHGRLVQSLEDASFDAWIKLYRPDESSANSGVSYYRKGELVCALLDLEIRARSGGKVSLDVVLKHLWDTYGVRNVAVPEDGMLAIFEEASGVKLADRFDAWVRAPGDLDYDAHARARRAHGRALACATGRRALLAGRAAALGRRQGDRRVGYPRRRSATRAGIDPGDELLGVGGSEGGRWRTSRRRSTAHAPGEAVDVLLARDGKLLTRRATLDPARTDKVKLVARADAAPAARVAFQAWLGRPHPTWTPAEGKS